MPTMYRMFSAAKSQPGNTQKEETGGQLNGSELKHSNTAFASPSEFQNYSVKIGPGRKLGADLLVRPDENQTGIAVVLLTLPPKSLAAPPHRHSREEEICFVLEGELTVWEEGRIQTLKAGESVVKSPNVLHTFWNAGDEMLRFIEIIAPGDFARFFQELDKIQLDGQFDQDDIQRVNVLNQKYGLEMAFNQTQQIMKDYNLNL